MQALLFRRAAMQVVVGSDAGERSGAVDAFVDAADHPDFVGLDRWVAAPRDRASAAGKGAPSMGEATDLLGVLRVMRRRAGPDAVDVRPHARRASGRTRPAAPRGYALQPQRADIGVRGGIANGIDRDVERQAVDTAVRPFARRSMRAAAEPGSLVVDTDHLGDPVQCLYAQCADDRRLGAGRELADQRVDRGARETNQDDDGQDEAQKQQQDRGKPAGYRLLVFVQQLAVRKPNPLAPFPGKEGGNRWM